MHAFSASEAIAMTGDVRQDNKMLAVKFVSELFLHFSVLFCLVRAVSWWRRLFSFLRNRVCRQRGDKEISVPTGPIFVSE